MVNDSRKLFDQASTQEAKLKDLKEFMANEQAKRESLGSAGGSRWRAAADNIPIKNYSKAVLDGKLKTTTTRTNKENLSETTPNPPTEKKLLIGQVAFSTEANNFKSKRSENGRKVTPTGKTRQRTPTQKSAPSKVETNLKQAIQNQRDDVTSDEGDEIGNFLEEIRLPQYLSVFKENGFDDLETLMQIKKKILEDMKIPPGHQIKIIKNLEKMGAKIENDDISLNSTTDERKLSAKSSLFDEKQGKTTEIVKAQSDFEIIEDPTRMGEIIENSDEIGVGTDDGPGNLLKGQFNEQESHQSFLEALHAWRSGKNTTDNVQPKRIIKTPVNNNQEVKAKTVRFNNDNEDSQNQKQQKPQRIESKPSKEVTPKGILIEKPASRGSGSLEKQSSETNIGTTMNTDVRSTRKDKRIGCWQCYKTFAEEEAVKDFKIDEKRMFCSTACFSNFMNLNSVTCSKIGCISIFLKEAGIIDEGNWYCAETCVPTLEEKLSEQKRKNEIIQSKEEQGNIVRPSKEDKANLSRENDDNDQELSPNAEDDDATNIDLDFSDLRTTNKTILTLEELERKYKTIREASEK